MSWTWGQELGSDFENFSNFGLRPYRKEALFVKGKENFFCQL